MSHVYVGTESEKKINRSKRFKMLHLEFTSVSFKILAAVL